MTGPDSRKVSGVWHRCLTIGGLMAVNYCLLVLNYRAVAAGSYVLTAITDAVIATASWTLLRRIAAAEHLAERLAYIAGGVVGSVVALWISLHIFHT